MLVQWNDRVVRWPAHGQMQLQVPLLAWFLPPDFGYRVGRSLHDDWAGRQLTDGAQVVSVAGHCDVSRARRVLILLVTFDPATLGARRPDGVHMARYVTSAVHEALTDA